MPTIPVLTPVRMARITLAGLVIAGMASSGIALAAGWTGPSSPAPSNNTPELIWNAQETGFTPQNASFNITGSGVLGQFAAGGYAIDAGGIAITAPSLWTDELGAGNATIYGDLTALRLTASEVTVERATPGPAVSAYHTGDSPGIFSASLDGIGAYGVSANGVGVSGKGLIGARFLNSSETITTDLATVSDGLNSTGKIVSPEYCIGASCITEWPAAGGGGSGDITGISAGPNLVGGGDTGEISLDLSATPTVDGITVSDRVDAARLFVTNSAAIPQIDFNGDGGSELAWSGTFSRLQFASQPHFVQGLTTQVGSTALFSGPVAVNGGYPLTVQGQVAAVSLCALSGMTCSTAPHVLGQTISAQTFCIGSDCRTSWPAGGGGGGTVTSISQGTGISATPNPITGAGTISFDQTYGDVRYVNAAGDLLMSGDFRVNSGTVNVLGNTDGMVLQATNSGGGFAVRGDNTGTGLGVYGNATSNTGVFGNSSSGVGVRGLSGSNFGVLGLGWIGARFLNSAGSITTDLSTATDGVNSNARIVAPELCIGSDCRTSWPAGGGGGGTVTSVGSGTGLTGGPITGAGTLSLDTGYTDVRYVNAAGDVMTGSATPGSGLLRVTNTGAGHGILADSANAGQSGIMGSNTAGGYGVMGFSTSAGGIGVWGRGSQFGGRFTNATDVAFTSLASDTVGVDTNRRIQAPEICIASVCRTTWPTGDAYVLKTGDVMSGILTVNNQLNVGSSAVNLAGNFHNSSGVLTYLAWGGTYGVYTTGQIYSTGNVRGATVTATGNLGAGNITLNGVNRTTWPDTNWTKVTGDFTVSSVWTTVSCTPGYNVVGITCWQNDPANGYPGCASRSSGSDTSVQIWRGNAAVNYTLYCLQML